MTKPTLDLDAALNNIMSAIYTRTAITPTPLTADNCQGKLRLGEKQNRLMFETNDVAQVLCPLLYLEAYLKDFGGKVYDEVKVDGSVAHLTVNVRFEYFEGGSNGVNLAFFRLAEDGSIVHQSFEMDKRPPQPQADF